LRKTFDGQGVIDLEVPEWADLNEMQKRKAIARRTTADKKKEDIEQEIRANKEKKEAERLLKMAEKEKEIEREGKAKGKGKKKAEGVGQAPVSSIVDQIYQVQTASQGAMKRKAILSELTEDMVTQGTQIITVCDDDVTSEELILNVSIIDIQDNMDLVAPNCYTEVMDFLKKINYFIFLA
jgi:hypothetical protein